jgi:hypothetical protein
MTFITKKYRFVPENLDLVTCYLMYSDEYCRVYNFKRKLKETHSYEQHLKQKSGKKCKNESLSVLNKQIFQSEVTLFSIARTEEKIKPMEFKKQKIEYSIFNKYG